MLTEDEERAMVVEEAFTWIGTPYHSNADVKGAGVDCGMIIVRVFADVGLIKPFDPRPYPAQWAVHQSAERYLAYVLDYAKEIPGPPKPGDVAMFKLGRTWSHGSIVIEWPWIIHATPPGKCRRENVKQHSKLVRMVPRFFSLWPRVAAEAKK